MDILLDNPVLLVAVAGITFLSGRFYIATCLPADHPLNMLFDMLDWMGGDSDGDGDCGGDGGGGE